MDNQAPSRLSFAHWEVLPEESVRRTFWLFATVLFGFRLLLLAFVPVDLSGDEAYYWEWGQHLDWGYSSKPPGIAWLMALASMVGGDTTFGIRMFAAVLGTGSLICLFQLARRLYGPAVALITGIAFVANPANAALNLVLTIDAPLMFFWTLSLYAFWEFIKTEPASCLSSGGKEDDRQRVKPECVVAKAGSRFDNMALGKNGMPGPPSGRAQLKWGLLLFFGLVGGMLSKQMMLVFLPIAVLFLALSRDHRAQLRRPGLWFVLLGSLGALLPPLWWNLRNDWVTVRHTMHHFESGGVSFGRQVGRFFEHIGSQCGIITPVLYLLIMAVVITVFWCWKRLGDRERFLWLFGGPALLVILLLGFRQRIHPNWPAVFYASTGILLAGWAAGRWSLDPKLDRWRWAFAPGLKIAVVFAVVVHVVVFALSFGLLRLPGLDPTARIRGWSHLASDVDAVRRELPGGNELTLVTQSHRFITSELAFYLHDRPSVYLYNSDPKSIGSQYDLWELPASRLGKDALIIIQGDPQSIAADLTNRFESVRVHSVLHYPGQSRALQVVTLAIGRNLQHWPSLRD